MKVLAFIFAILALGAPQAVLAQVPTQSGCIPTNDDCDPNDTDDSDRPGVPSDD